MMRSRLARVFDRRDRLPRGDAVILMYHRVATVSRDPWRLAVTAERFAEHLSVIANRFEPLSLHGLAGMLAAGKVRRGSVVVTFDDGYRDNLVAAKPLLEASGVPATIFVTTGYVDSARDFWWDELDDVCAPALLDVRQEWGRLQPLTREEREAELNRLWLSVGLERPSASRTLSGAEVVDLDSSELIEVGAHTVSHPRLTAVSASRQRLEVQVSKKALETLLGRPIRAFSYPHGDLSPTTVDLVRTAGFTTACTITDGPLTSKARPFELPRLHALDWSGDELEAQLERRLRRRR